MKGEGDVVQKVPDVDGNNQRRKGILIQFNKSCGPTGCAVQEQEVELGLALFPEAITTKSRTYILRWSSSSCILAVPCAVIISSPALLVLTKAPTEAAQVTDGSVSFFRLDASDDMRGEQNIFFEMKLHNKKPSVALLRGRPRRPPPVLRTYSSLMVPGVETK
ncbi:hypothetical protein H920_17615 [Fukomys damarensis]|uniref:Uncharacterized protein n=1 Tax=Fukomys damarensis TaxID=885580 RepID=A0A091CRX2_FUKDA|nr:hypothetical protein H920_17615 [Fukomys damarensis]